MFKAHLKWKVDPVEAMSHLTRGLQNKAMRIALNAGASPVKAAVIDAAPAETGSLKKSFRIKVKNYKNKGIWVAVIGVKSDFQKKRGKVIKRPGNYVNLVDKGTRHIRGRHFMDSAYSKARDSFVSIAKAKLAEQIKLLVNTVPKK